MKFLYMVLVEVLAGRGRQQTYTHRFLKTAAHRHIVITHHPAKIHAKDASVTAQSLNLERVARIAAYAPGNSKVLQDVVSLARTSVKKQDPQFVASSLVTIHHALWKLAAEDPPNIMDAVNGMRADMCKGRMENEDCKKFLEDHCKPGKDKVMDGDQPEVSTGKGICKQFFPPEEKVKKKVEQKVEQKVVRQVKQVKVKKVTGHPEQGFEGRLVSHDGETQNADWRHEYGVHAQTAKEACKDHPKNAWCVQHASSATMITLSIAALLLL